MAPNQIGMQSSQNGLSNINNHAQAIALGGVNGAGNGLNNFLMVKSENYFTKQAVNNAP